MRFDDDIVIVTGAGRGLGREHALAFAARGAAVVVNEVGVEADGSGGSASIAQIVIDEIVAGGGHAIADSHSVTTAEGAQAIVRAALDAFGKATVLVDNAGIIGFAPIEEVDDESWRRMTAVTLDGTFQMSKAV